MAAVIGLVLYIFVFSVQGKMDSNGKKGCGCPHSKEGFQLRDLLGKKPIKEHLAEDGKFDDNVVYTKGSHYMKQDPQMAREANSSGLVTVNSGINTPLQMDGNADFQVQYAQLISGEIGQDVINSQQEYNKYVATDNSIRYIDTDIETDYIPFQGISLSRVKAPTVNSSNSTQI